MPWDLRRDREPPVPDGIRGSNTHHQAGVFFAFVHHASSFPLRERWKTPEIKRPAGHQTRYFTHTLWRRASLSLQHHQSDWSPFTWSCCLAARRSRHRETIVIVGFVLVYKMPAKSRKPILRLNLALRAGRTLMLSVGAKFPTPVSLPPASSGISIGTADVHE